MSFSMKAQGVILAILLFSTIANAADKSKQCNMFTSQPDYKTMTLMVGDGVWQNIAIVDGKTFKYTSFADAYEEFYSNVQKSIQKNCDRYDTKGVVNLKINFATTDKQYLFSAQYDYYK